MMITSKDNELIKSLSKLLTSPKYRREHSEFAAEGVRLCADGAQSGAEISWFIYTARAAEKYAAEFALLHSCCQKSCEISESLLKKIADTKSPQGFICVFKMNSSCFQVKKQERYLALESIQDPSNMGTILRSAEAFGISGVIVSGDCCDIYSPKVVRGSMGAVFRLPIIQEENFSEYIRDLTAKRIFTYASTPRNADDIETIDFSNGGVLLIGNEGNGLKEETINACYQRICIRMNGRAESLNASAAAAVLLYRLCVDKD